MANAAIGIYNLHTYGWDIWQVRHVGMHFCICDYGWGMRSPDGLQSNLWRLLLLHLQALSPHHALIAFTGPEGFVSGWRLLSAVVLCITGAEAMYADLGHFSSQAVWVSMHARRCTSKCKLGQLQMSQGWRISDGFSG